MEKRIRVNSSSNDGTYTVVFKFDNDFITINCDCQAGLVKMLCKHRLNLVDGDTSALTDKSDSIVLDEVLKLLDKNRFTGLFNELNTIEKELKRLDTLKKKLRKEIGLKISNGF
jgi:hypothetical protein